MKILSAIIVFLATNPASAATYNYYFNNAEQGDNSTASPAITVKKDTPDEAAPPEAAPVAAPVPPPVSAQIIERHQYLRVTGGFYLGHAEVHDTFAEKFFNDPFFENNRSTSIGGPVVSGSIFFTRDLGATVFLGGLTGIEINLLPIHIGANQNVDIGFLAGGLVNGLDLLNKAGVHLGAEALVYVSKNWGLQFAARSTFTNRDSFELFAASVSVAMRFP